MAEPGFCENELPDFEVTVTFLSAEDGGRKTPANQGYLRDIVFEEEPYTWMIHPAFLRADGSPFARNEPVPQDVRANMYVFSDHVRPWLREIVHVGRKVRMVEGNRTVAQGAVTAIKNLLHDFCNPVEAAVAFAYCARAYMRQLHELLGQLQAAAASLPAVAPETPESSTRRRFAQQIAFETKLPFKSYRAVVDPLNDSTPEPAVETSLMDDLADIFDDLDAGMSRYRAGSHRDALWEWRFSYYTLSREA
jgi:hypothetical protein